MNVITIDRLRLTLVSAIALAISVLVACGGDETSTTPADSSTPQTAPTAASVPATAAPATARPQPTATPAPTRTPLPPQGRAAADYTEDELADIAVDLTREFYEAVTTVPVPDLERAMATYSEACQPADRAEFAQQIEATIDFFDGRELTIQVLAATRLPNTDEAALILAIGLLDDEPASGATRSLLVFENGRWFDGECPAARAQFLGPESGAQSTPVPDMRLSDNPAEHTEEQIAHSVEFANQAAWSALLSDPPIDLNAVRGLAISECQIETDEDLSQVAAMMSAQVGDSTIVTVIIGVQRLDDTRAWTSGQLELDGIPVAEVPPSLVAFEDGRWRDASCLSEGDSNLAPPTYIQPGDWLR